MASNINAVRDGTLLALLAIQVGIQPVLIKWYARDTSSVVVRLLVTEILKVVIACSSLLYKEELYPELKQWTFSMAWATTVIPSLIYVLQNYLNQEAVTVLDGVTFNILNQTKIIWTAILVYVMLNKPQSRHQVGALVLLLGGAVLMTTSGKDNAAANQEDMHTTQITQALIAAVCSGFAGTIIQKALQKKVRNPYMVTIELSIVGILILLVTVVLYGNGATKDPWKGWTVMTVVTLLIQAMGGILVGFVIKYSGNVWKSFVVVIGLVLTAIIECTVNGEQFGSGQYGAVFLVSISTCIYAKYPAKTRPSYQTLPRSDRSLKE